MKSFTVSVGIKRLKQYSHAKYSNTLISFYIYIGKLTVNTHPENFEPMTPQPLSLPPTLLRRENAI